VRLAFSEIRIEVIAIGEAKRHIISKVSCNRSGYLTSFYCRVKSLNYYLEQTMKMLLLTGAALIVLIGTAFAQQPQFFGKAGDWDIYQGAFFCWSSTPSSNGTEVSFAQYTDGVIRIIIRKEGWNIPDGQYQVGFQIDKLPRDTLKAHGYQEAISIAFPMEETIFNLLTKLRGNGWV